MNELAAAVFIATVLLLLKSRVNYNRLPELTPRPAAASGEAGITVVIPARNEAAGIAGAVRSFPSGRVIVVDDASGDETARLALEAGARVIPAPSLRRGEKGKAAACAAGAREARTEWVLFIDADTSYAPEFLGSLASYAREHSLDMGSVLLEHRYSTFVENLLSPYARALYFTAVDSKRVNSFGSANAIADGHCLLFRSQAYEFIGGHRSLIKSPVEDVQLALTAKRHRLRCHTVRSGSLGQVNLRGGWRNIWRRFGRSAPRFSLAHPWAQFQMVLSSLLMMSCLPIAVWSVANAQVLTGILFLLLPVALLVPWYRSRMALFSLAAIYLLPLMALNSMASLLFARRIPWKGRRV